MKFSRASPEMENPTGVVYPFVADGGIRVATISSCDPYVILDDLMAVVETLCPVWPMRETFVEMRHARL